MRILLRRTFTIDLFLKVGKGTAASFRLIGISVLRRASFLFRGTGRSGFLNIASSSTGKVEPTGGVGGSAAGATCLQNREISPLFKFKFD